MSIHNAQTQQHFNCQFVIWLDVVEVLRTGVYSRKLALHTVDAVRLIDLGSQLPKNNITQIFNKSINRVYSNEYHHHLYKLKMQHDVARHSTMRAGQYN